MSLYRRLSILASVTHLTEGGMVIVSRTPQTNLDLGIVIPGLSGAIIGQEVRNAGNDSPTDLFISISYFLIHCSRFIWCFAYK